jgi:hypothetical protein
MRIRDTKSLSPWIREGKFRIRDKHPGSATVLKVAEYVTVKKVVDFLNDKKMANREGIK